MPKNIWNRCLVSYPFKNQKYQFHIFLYLQLPSCGHIDVTNVNTQLLDLKLVRLEIGNDFIEIRNYNFAKNLLQKYGHHIQKLTFHHEKNFNKQVREIYQLINLHCSKTLKEIIIDNWSREIFLDEFQNIFENVDNITFLGNLETNQMLNKMFPSVRHMQLNIYQ